MSVPAFSDNGDFGGLFMRYTYPTIFFPTRGDSFYGITGIVPVKDNTAKTGEWIKLRGYQTFSGTTVATLKAELNDNTNYQVEY